MKSNPFSIENTVSLSPQFLSYLMEKNEDTDGNKQESVDHKEGSLRDISKHSSMMQPVNPSNVEESIYTWNQKHDAVQNYDPFEKVMLVKGIDNSILTSFRTLKRDNNTVSDTFKIVHQKFLPQKQQGMFMK